MNTLLATAAANAAAGVFAGLYILLWILGVIGSIMLILAPIKIWKWTKRTCQELEALGALLSREVAAQRKDAKYLAAIYEHVKNLDQRLTAETAQ